MLCSRYRQRIGDHLARTLVISTRPAAYRPPQFASPPSMRAEDVGTGTGQSGMGQAGTGQPGMGQTSIGQPSMGQGNPGDIR